MTTTEENIFLWCVVDFWGEFHNLIHRGFL